MGKSFPRSKQTKSDLPLQGFRVLTLAVNVPGPLAAKFLRELGARVTKIEPPGGDPLKEYCSKWYGELVHKQKIIRLDLKSPEGRSRLEHLLSRTDLLLTASRPAALQRLGLSWHDLHTKFPALCCVALIGHPAPRSNFPGHDLTYQAKAGLIAPPNLPTSLLADLASAERIVSKGLGVLLRRQRFRRGSYDEVVIEDVANNLSSPLRYGLTSRGGMLGGKLAQYNLYRARDRWVAVAALESHFWERLKKELRLNRSGVTEISDVLRSRTAREWERWAVERDLPIVAVRRLNQF